MQALAVVDLLGHGEIFLRDGLVGDACVNHGHRQGLVAQQRRDRVKTHAPVDGLGRKSVSELVGGDVADAGVFGKAVERIGHAEFGDRPSLLDE